MKRSKNYIYSKRGERDQRPDCLVIPNLEALSDRARALLEVQGTGARTGQPTAGDVPWLRSNVRTISCIMHMHISRSAHTRGLQLPVTPPPNFPMFPPSLVLLLEPVDVAELFAGPVTLSKIFTHGLQAAGGPIDEECRL